MVIHDISKEIFSTEIYPGDPIPSKKIWFAIESGNVCNLTRVCLGNHSGTHIDAPKHFLSNGKGVSEIDLDRCIGKCQLVCHAGKIEAGFWENVWKKGMDKILFRGNVQLDVNAAENIVKYGVKLIGVESSTVGDEVCQQQVHKILLKEEVVILENLRLNEIQEGEYFLAAQPLKMQDLDGSPVRAILVEY